MQLCPRELQWLISITFLYGNCTDQVLRLLEPLISFRNRRRIAFATKIMTPIIEERRAIIEHNMKNKEDQLDVPVRCTINRSCNISSLCVPELIYHLRIGGPAPTPRGGSYKNRPSMRQY